MASFIRTKDHLTVVFDDGESVTVYDNNPNYESIVDAVRRSDWEEVRQLSMPVEQVKKTIVKSERSGNVSIVGGVVYFNGIAMDTTLTRRMLQMIEEGFDIQPMATFLTNLMENPSYRAVNELYDFLEKSDLPITEDGHFLAYKRVRKNYTDCHSGKIDNSIGVTVSMPRNQVDEDKTQTCSTGLHFCSREYLSHYGLGDSNRTVIVKINPRDVVSIPVDYNNAKGRCCQYEVVGELKHKEEEPLESLYRKTPKSILCWIDPYDEEILGTFSSYEEAKGASAVDEECIRDAVNNKKPDFQEGWIWEWRDVNEVPTPNVSGKESNSQNKISYHTPQAVAMVDPTTGRVEMTFTSSGDAMVRTGVDSSSIRKVCLGQRKTAGGKGWKFVDSANVTPTANSTNTPKRDPYHDLDDDEYDEDWCNSWYDTDDMS